MAILCCSYRRDFAYSLLYTSIALYVIFGVIAMTQTGISSDTDACAGLTETVCKGEGQPCLYWTGIPCNATRMEDDGQEMCKWSNKQCQTNKNWFKTTGRIRNLPKICKVSQRMHAGTQMGQFGTLLLVFNIIAIVLFTPAYLYQHSWLWDSYDDIDDELADIDGIGRKKDACYRCEKDKQGCVRIHMWLTIFLILWNIITVVLCFSYSGALTNVERGCLFQYDEDTDGELEWPDTSLFYETYFEGFTTPGILTMSAIFIALSVIILSVYVWFHFTYKDKGVLSYDDDELETMLKRPRRKRMFT